MTREAKRGCGYRQQGGLYMVCGKFNASCNGLPFELEVCPVCSGGIKQARGWTWIEPMALFTHDTSTCTFRHCGHCPVSNPPQGKHGLLWIGAAHYPTPGDFMAEARQLGVSKRVQFVPNDFELGKTLIYLAHPLACVGRGKRITALNVTTSGNMGSTSIETSDRRPGVITVFKPERVELIVSREQAEDGEFVAKCDKRGVTPVVLDDDEVEPELAL